MYDIFIPSSQVLVHVTYTPFRKHHILVRQHEQWGELDPHIRTNRATNLVGTSDSCSSISKCMSSWKVWRLARIVEMHAKF
jgi:hypothetical protein